MDVFLITTFTPGMGLPSSLDTTLPVTLTDCEKAISARWTIITTKTHLQCRINMPLSKRSFFFIRFDLVIDSSSWRQVVTYLRTKESTMIKHVLFQLLARFHCINGVI